MNEADIKVIKEIEENLASCLLGKRKEIKLVLTALLAGGHVLLEGVPGTGKTLLVKALARSIQGEFRRVQCNPDLLPTDVTGFSMYHPKEEQFLFRPGPVMTNILLMDEINRTSTKTQSALLEAMEEKQVSVDGKMYALPEPFFVLATQNPIEFEGTYPLPEAQLDRFMMKFHLGYPDKATEKNLLLGQNNRKLFENLNPVTEIETIASLQQQIEEVYVDDEIVDYILSITEETREHPYIYLGASPRAALSLLHGVKALALIEQRTFVTPDDVKFLAPYVYCHRLMLKPEAKMDGLTEQAILQSIMKNVRVPI
ncbi:AAA family ATPase [Halalkalibacter alkaliphilus]|uniref:MoxR family ATPase n=1 Tax=Halalkalibacter alkaliphilus TaxID=2917993 RepID=A0A9X2CVW2_9BACI|nr:MoxR family ATPase [Halalkalibacter alkaliphilus]MCL7749223.1 MoxR family ATPase [Halalkalibacter alkaliphilus]